jgi:hypothetical protein
MSESLPTSLSIEEAVARMVNIGNLPIGVPLIDFLDQLVANAEDDFNDARNKNLPSDHVHLLERRKMAANARFQLASELKLHMEWELETPNYLSLLKVSDRTSSVTRLELDSVELWARFHYDIYRFDYEELNYANTEKPITTVEKAVKEIDEEGLKPLVAKRLYVLFAHVLEALVEVKNNPTGFGTSDNMNVSSIAELICQRIVNFKGTAKSYDTEIIKGRIETAVEMKKQYGKK